MALIRKPPDRFSEQWAKSPMCAMTARTIQWLNETIDRRSLIDGVPGQLIVRQNLLWATKKKVDPAKLSTSVRVDNPTVVAPDEQSLGLGTFEVR